MIIAIVFFPLQGLSIQPCEPLNPRAVRTDIGGRVCTQCAGQEARSAGCKLYLACLQTPGLRGCSKPRARCLHARASASPSTRWQQPRARARARGQPNAHACQPKR